MSVTSGFFNSNNGDRTYDALDVSRMFDGVIRDGVYAGFLNEFNVTAGVGMSVNVAPGRAWFNHTWTLNDATLNIPLTGSHGALARKDLIVIKVDLSARLNSITKIEGTPANPPARPSYTNTSSVFYYPIAEVTINAGASAPSAILKLVGTSVCPYVVAPVQSVSTQSIIDALTSQANDWFGQYTNNNNAKLKQVIKDAIAEQTSVRFCTFDIPETEDLVGYVEKEGSIVHAPQFYPEEAMSVDSLLIGANGYLAVVEHVNLSSLTYRYRYKTLGVSVYAPDRPMVFFGDYNVDIDAVETEATIGFFDDLDELAQKHIPALVPKVGDCIIGKNGYVAKVTYGPFKNVQNKYGFRYLTVTDSPVFPSGGSDVPDDRPMIFFVPHVIETDAQENPTAYGPEPTLEDLVAIFAPSIAPKVGDYVIGKNGYVGTVTSAPYQGVGGGYYYRYRTVSYLEAFDSEGVTDVTSEYLSSSYSTPVSYLVSQTQSEGKYLISLVDDKYIASVNTVGTRIFTYIQHLSASSSSETSLYIDGVYNGGVIVDDANNKLLLTGLRDPVGNTDAATKKYVDDAVRQSGGGGGSVQWVDVTEEYQESGETAKDFALSLTTDGKWTFTAGNRDEDRYYVTVEHSPDRGEYLYTKIDILSDTFLSSSEVFINGTSAGSVKIPLTNPSIRIFGLGTPFYDDEAANKKYVDDAVRDTSTADAVRYTEQELTGAQKAQARLNIGATDGQGVMSESLKQALMNCFEHVAWTDDQGPAYCDALYSALYPVDRITAVFDPGQNTIYDTETLDSLRQYLTVTAVFEDGTTKSTQNYTLSGALTEGTSTITVTSSGKTANFSVTVTHNPYLYILKESDFMREYGIGDNTLPDYITATKTRICYAAFDLAVEPSKTYQIDWDSTYATAGLSVKIYKQAAMTNIANGVAISSSNVQDLGTWYSPEESITFTSSSTAACVRFQFRQADNSPVIADAFKITQLTIKEVTT